MTSLTLRVQWADAGIQKFEGMDYHDSQWDEAVSLLYAKRLERPVVRIILVGDHTQSDDWIVLVDKDEVP